MPKKWNDLSYTEQQDIRNSRLDDLTPQQRLSLIDGHIQAAETDLQDAVRKRDYDAVAAKTETLKKLEAERQKLGGTEQPDSRLDSVSAVEEVFKLSAAYQKMSPSQLEELRSNNFTEWQRLIDAHKAAGMAKLGL